MPPPADHLLRTFAAVPTGSRVLDLGCGAGRHTVPLAQLGFDVYGCDPDADAVAACRTRLGAVREAGDAEDRVTEADLDALPYADDAFDWVVAYRVYTRHATAREELMKLLRETRRVLGPGGWLYLVVPAVPKALNPTAAAPGYAGDSGLRLAFTPETLDALLEAAGFAVAAEAAPAEAQADDASFEGLRAIYRRVDPGTPV